MSIEDFKLELTVLQRKDTEDAKNLGYNDKDAWFKHIMSEEHDEVAEAIINLAERAEIKEDVVAYYFDPTMLIRLAKVRNKT